MRDRIVNPRLEALLVKYGLTLDQFYQRGRPAARYKKQKSDLVTELHQAGTTWKEMLEITGLALGSIQRLTKAMWNSNSRKSAQENGKKVGALCKGMKREWLTKQLKESWEQGKFDFHKGRKRSEEEKARLKAGWTVERREQQSESKKQKWQTVAYRDKLVAYHNQPEIRAKYSREQTRRMSENPVKWTRGRGAYVDTLKGTKKTIWTRSSYERAAIKVLDADSTVISYDYEPMVFLGDKRWILPDFIVTFVDCSKKIIEVKASWVLTMPVDDKRQKRLNLARDYALNNQLGFDIWTEKDRLKDAIRTTK